MIESMTWTNIRNGQSVVMNANDTPFETFSTEVVWRQEQTENPQEHGVDLGYPYLGERMFHAEGEILKQDSAGYMTLRRNLVRSMIPSPRYGNKVVGTLQILFTGMSEAVKAECSLDGFPELPMEALGPAHGKFQINWKAPDPRLFSVDEYSAITGTPGTTSGRTYPKTYPKVYTASTGTAGDITITNSGDIEVYPRVEILGPCTYPSLTMLTPAPVRVVEFGDLIVDSGEIITVDFEKRSAVSNLGRDVYFTLTSREWWALDPGSNSIRYSAFQASSPSKATFYWRNAYMI